MTVPAPHEALVEINDAIRHAAKIARRKASDISLVAISKTHPAEAIRPLLAAGHRLFGENRVQEAQEKWPALVEEFHDTELHLVGQLQSNKAEDALALFNTIHSLDRASLVKAIGKAQDKLGKRVPCFIQVNIGEEEQKGGCAIADTPSLITAARDADIDVAGLMCVPPLDVEPAPYFALLAKMAADNGLSQLSMGMSGDFEIAIQLGATHVRVGSALFGARG